MNGCHFGFGSSALTGWEKTSLAGVSLCDSTCGEDSAGLSYITQYTFGEERVRPELVVSIFQRMGEGGARGMDGGLGRGAFATRDDIDLVFRRMLSRSHDEPE